MSLKEKINIKKLPVHVAIIMDGNGRWALKQGEDRVFGHHKGVDAVREIAETAAELGVKFITLYTFSTENWNRPQNEVNALMSLFVETIEKEIPTLNKNNIRLNAIGDLQSLPEENYTRLINTMDQTAKNDRMTLTLALSYSSRWEITNAVNSIIGDIKSKKLNDVKIDEETFAN